MDIDNQAGKTLQYERIFDGGLRNNDKSLCGLISEVKNVLVIISTKYLDSTNLLPLNSATKLLKHISLNFQVACR